MTRECDYKGEGKLGPLVVDYDETARLVRVTTSDGRIWRYQDGATGRLGPVVSAADDPGPVGFPSDEPQSLVDFTAMLIVRGGAAL